MPEKTTVGFRLPVDYLEEIDAICKATGRIRSQVLLEAVEAYLGKTSSEDVKSSMEALQKRIEALEKKSKNWSLVEKV